MSNDWQHRLESLEINQAFLEESVEKLSQQVHWQQQEIEALQRKIKGLLKQLSSQRDTEGAASPVFNPEDEVPPHY